MDSINKLNQDNDQPINLVAVIIALTIGLLFIGKNWYLVWSRFHEVPRISVIFILLKKHSVSRKDFILTGLCDSGKTLIFSQLLYSKYCDTFTSIAENLGFYEVDTEGCRVVDIPGHERLRGKFFDQYKNSAKGVVFVVDSVTLQKDVKDVAEWVLRSIIPVLDLRSW